ncbi:MAG: hypothetical protein FJW37_03075 [Acidobacteria bacterium]|nr:hypothetical protein [Acidobacteriota bacterium]
MRSKPYGLLLAMLLLASDAGGQKKYTGPKPPKPDHPYLQHADTLLPTEASQAREQAAKDEIRYVVAGASSSARTPLASPVLLLQAAELAPDKLELYRLQSRAGEREVVFSKKNKKNDPRPLRLSVASLGDSLYRIEVDESLAAGEYSLTPSGSNQVFCFQVY